MPGVGSYIDDIVIYSDSLEDHIRTLKELLGRLRKARITARPTKCLLGASRSEVMCICDYYCIIILRGGNVTIQLMFRVSF